MPVLSIIPFVLHLIAPVPLYLQSYLPEARPLTPAANIEDLTNSALLFTTKLGPGGLPGTYNYYSYYNSSAYWIWVHMHAIRSVATHRNTFLLILLQFHYSLNWKDQWRIKQESIISLKIKLTILRKHSYIARTVMGKYC